MRLLPSFARDAPAPGVHRGRDVAIGRDARLEVNAGAQLVLGDGCRIGERTRIVVQAGRVEIGAHGVLGERCTLVAVCAITIGARAQLGDGVVLVDFDHVIADVERPIRVQGLESTPIVVGDGARIGFGASLLRGVSVGAGATVDPHAVVTRDVAPGAHVGGVPAKPGDRVTPLD
ncbi:MAG TPA: acyltransferase [Solirubrobacteraceae bacterium]